MNEDFTALDLSTHEERVIPKNRVQFEPPGKRGVILRPERLRVSTTLLRDTETGEIFLDPMKRYAKPYWLSTEPREITLNLAPTPPPGALVSAPIVMPIDHRAAYEIDYSYFKSDGDFTIVIFDPNNRPVLMNREIHIRTIASGFGTLGLPGPAGRPFIWPEPWYMFPSIGSRNFMVGFRDLTGLQNKVRFLLHGRMFHYGQSPEHVVKRYEDYYKNRPVTMPFFYTTNQIAAVTGVAGTETDFEIRIDDDADVLIYKMTAVSSFPFEFKIIEKMTNRELMTDFVRVDNGFGDGEFPYVLFEPLYYEAGTKLVLRIRKLTNDNDIIWPTFTSSKIFRSTRKRPLGAR